MLSIYNFNDPIEFLSSYLTQEQQKDPHFSLKKFSTDLGLKSSVGLIDVLKRKKKLKDSLAQKIVKYLDIDNSEKMYFEAIVARSQVTIEEKMRMYDLIIQELIPTKKASTFSILRTSDLNIFSHWVYTAILALGELPNFKLTISNIRRKLIEDIDEKLVEKALFELMTNGVLVINEEGEIKNKYNRTTTKSDSKHINVKVYYEMICDLAKKSINLPLESREVNMFSFSIDDKNVPLAKEIIRKCRNSLSRLSEQGTPNQVYQASLVLFPLTKN